MQWFTRAIYVYMPAAVAALALGYVPSAHAGWLDSLTTFREEQKPLVSNNSRNAPPKMVYQPYYNPSDHVAWSNFYTRADLEPQDYLTNSASKVMRPRPQEQYAATPAQAQGGWDAVAEQAMQNAQEEQAHIVIGEPGNSPAMQGGTADVGQATRIGSPVKDWREATDGVEISSRPGDYDYRMSDARQDAAREATPAAMVAAPRGEVDPELKNDPRYVGFNDAGKVNKYSVQRGDTLSSISSQPAIYNTWKLWPLIYSANRKAIGKDPDNIHFEQRLDIPRDYSNKQGKEAERRALGRKPGVYGDGR